MPYTTTIQQSMLHDTLYNNLNWHQRGFSLLHHWRGEPVVKRRSRAADTKISLPLCDILGLILMKYISHISLHYTICKYARRILPGNAQEGGRRRH